MCRLTCFCLLGFAGPGAAGPDAPRWFKRNLHTHSLWSDGDEIYVRAKIISSKAKPNASVADEVECAWTQPLANAVAPASSR